MIINKAEDFINHIVQRQYTVPPAVVRQVQTIVEAVKSKGDEAVTFYETKFNIKPANLQVPIEIMEQAIQDLDQDIRTALIQSITRVKEYHQKLPIPRTQEVTVGKSNITFDVRPLRRVGIYIPGGRASYPSTVVMTAIPAQVARVDEIILCTPPGPTGLPSAVTLAAARECGVNKVFCCGGAQAIAAMAYGTQSIPKVDKIVGPGNTFVTAAKKEVFGIVDIDGLAGPSEAMIVLDPTVTNKVLEWCVWDLKAQFEHDPESICVLVTTDPELAARLAPTVQEIPGHMVVCTGGWEEVCDVIEAFAPEHLELVGPGPESLAKSICNAGAVFVGPLSPVAMGDYIAGPSHVLPTGGSARCFSGLWTGSFLRVHSVININPKEFMSLATTGEVLARGEGLLAHAQSLAVRRRTW
jgi:histidinol dehydrogenase